MSELKWNWVYYPYLDAPTKQEESALKAGYIKVVVKSEADKVISEKDNEIAELKEFVQDAEYFKNLAESYHKRWLNAKNELDAYKVKEADK